MYRTHSYSMLHGVMEHRLLWFTRIGIPCVKIYLLCIIPGCWRHPHLDGYLKQRSLECWGYNEECLKCFIFVFFSNYTYLVYHNVLIYDRISYNLMYYMWVLLVNYDFCLDLMNGINWIMETCSCMDALLNSRYMGIVFFSFMHT